MTTEPRTATRVHLATAFLALGALWFILCRQLSGEWSINEQYTYGWFVPFFAAYLFWLRWEDRPQVRGQRSEVRDQKAEIRSQTSESPLTSDLRPLTSAAASPLTSDLRSLTSAA